MISLDLYRARIGLFRGGSHYRAKREKQCNVEGTWADYALVLLCIIGPLIVLGSFCCAVRTNAKAFSTKARGFPKSEYDRPMSVEISSVNEVNNSVYWGKHDVRESPATSLSARARNTKSKLFTCVYRQEKRQQEKVSGGKLKTLCWREGEGKTTQCVKDKKGSDVSEVSTTKMEGKHSVKNNMNSSEKRQSLILANDVHPNPGPPGDKGELGNESLAPAKDNRRNDDRGGRSSAAYEKRSQGKTVGGPSTYSSTSLHHPLLFRQA